MRTKAETGEQCEKTGGYVEVVKCSKKFRETCYAVMDGYNEALEVLETFVKYPHQIAAVKAEMAYFDRDYERALELDLSILPFFEEWQYANVGDEHMAAMTFAAVKLRREKEVIEAFTKEKERIQVEGGRPQRSRYCELMKVYLQKGILPFADRVEAHYQDPADGKTREELCQEIKAADKKIDLESVKGKSKLYYFCRTYGYAKDAVAVYEQIQNEPMTESDHKDAVARYLYLGEQEKAIRTVEYMAAARLWSVAAPTQVRPMSFFTMPVMHSFLADEAILKRIREAACIDNGTLIRK